MCAEAHPLPIQSILEIPFYQGSEASLADWIRAGKGLIVVPAGPGLAEIDREETYRESLQKADYALVDSGLLAILWFCSTGKSLSRISGLRFLEYLIDKEKHMLANDSFWVFPNKVEADLTVEFLTTQGITINPNEQSYIAPVYDRSSIADPDLANILQGKNPTLVILNIGGGVQEPLGYYLKEKLKSGDSTILCTGAAIAFKTRAQVNIPKWVDRLYLGWLWRIGSSPLVYGKRYLKAFRLIPIYFRYMRPGKEK